MGVLKGELSAQYGAYMNTLLKFCLLVLKREQELKKGLTELKHVI